ncbi:hypothetical protein DFJ73DRAFT_962177 [Zopfochytrium polystomum]|nr:hypothetical protein DFJ73DRAFT_962177 [Zopfochytrium polystomum]
MCVCVCVCVSAQQEGRPTVGRGYKTEGGATADFSCANNQTSDLKENNSPTHITHTHTHHTHRTSTTMLASSTSSQDNNNDATTTATNKSNKSNNEDAELAAILHDLRDLKHGLVALKKRTHGAVTLADLDSQTDALGLIMNRLRDHPDAGPSPLLGWPKPAPPQPPHDHAHPPPPPSVREQIDATLDAIWTLLLSSWSAAARVDPLLYPSYAALAGIVRAADALRRGGAYAPADVDALAARLRAVESRVERVQVDARAREAREEADDVAKELLEGDAGEGGGGKPARPHAPALREGQAVLSALAHRAHRVLRVMTIDDDEDAVAAPLRPVLAQLRELRGKLDALLDGGEKAEGGAGADGETTTTTGLDAWAADVETVKGFYEVLHAIDATRDENGRFISVRDGPPTAGEALCASLLHANFDRLYALITRLDPVPATSPLYAVHQDLLRIDAALDALANSSPSSTTPADTATQLRAIEADVARIEDMRVAGVIVPPPASSSTDNTAATTTPSPTPLTLTSSAALLVPGQLTLARQLTRIHSRMARLLDAPSSSSSSSSSSSPVVVGARLLPTYEQLSFLRGRLWRLRSRAAAASPRWGLWLGARPLALAAATPAARDEALKKRRKEAVREAEAVGRELAAVERRRRREGLYWAEAVVAAAGGGAGAGASETVVEEAGRDVVAEAVAATAAAAAAAAAAGGDRAGEEENGGGEEDLDDAEWYVEVGGGGSERRRRRVPAGQVVVTALADECESLLCEVMCFLAVEGDDGDA